MLNRMKLPLALAIPLIFSLASGAVNATLPAVVGGSELPSLAPMVDKVVPAVVNIATRSHIEAQNHPMMNDPLFQYFFRGMQPPERSREARSLGSGVVIDASEGYIVTNHHVVNGADQITITLNDGKQYDAKVVGSDPDADVAVIKVDAKGLTALPFADSEKLRVGDFVVAIGNPFGLGQTVTSGIISALGRTGLGIEGYENFVQTDASINPGNSGGALVNLSGELVGMNTAIIAAGGSGNIGIGFAIPINMVRQIADQLIEFGEVHRGMLGVVMQNLTPDLAKAFGLDLHQGVVISQVIEKSAAEKAGLKAGDVVLSINDTPIKSASAMRNIVGLLRVGDKMDIKVIRDNRKLSLKAVLQEADNQSVAGNRLNERLAGATIEQSKDDGEVYLVVTAVERGSPAWNARLREGDIILSVNRKLVNNIEELRKILNSADKQILLNVQRGNTALFILIQ
jgi:serine protease Do/serine protease DegQ